MNNELVLFSQYDLCAVMEVTKSQMLKEIEEYPANQLLNTSPEDLADYFADKFEIVPLRALDDQIQADQEETKIDVSWDSSRYRGDRSGPFYVPGTLIMLHVPFEGNPDLFNCIPSHFSSNPPRGIVNGNTLELFIARTDHDVAAVKGELNHLLENTRWYMEWIGKDLAPYNSALRAEALGHINARRQKLLKDQGLVAALGFPLCERPGAPFTYTTPEVRRKVTPKPPPASTQPYVPEPRLEMAEYENILSIIKKTAAMLERSPQAFVGMDEENLRDQFLVPLNSHYEGQATGETFNFNGKTDILVRDGDRSVFVAECKIWRGTKYLSSAIDQLLGYATWRDTKTAILLFNRNKQLTEVLAQIPTVLKSHPNFKREIPFPRQSGFRCVLANKDDLNRELILTVLVFEVPK